MGSPEETRLVLQGRQAFLDFTPEAHKEAERLWGEAFEMNPEGGMTNLVQGWLHQQKLVLGLSRNPMISITKARMHAEKAFGIMGDGNSAFEVADYLTDVCNIIIVNSKLFKPIQFAFSVSLKYAVSGRNESLYSAREVNIL